MGKNVLVIGQGAREHAMVWKLKQSRGVDQVFAVPGNAGIAELAECFDVKLETGNLFDLIDRKRIDLTVVGPEAPLMEGIVDEFEARGLKIFGPRRDAALLEGSKVFTKNLLKKYGVPTADFQSFSDIDEARDYLRKKGTPIVVKRIDAKARQAFNLEREVDLQKLFVVLALRIVHDVVHHGVHRLVIERLDIDASHIAVHPDHGRQFSRQVQVGGLVLDAERE